MKNVLIGILFSLSSVSIAATNVGLPELHKIKRVTLRAPYSCGGSYESSALFLSEHSKNRNSPDLLYNGACRADNYIHASTAGDDFSLIADLGDVPLEMVSASRSFNWNRTTGENNIFKATQKVKLGHTYAVLSSKSQIRALYVFKIVDHKIDNSMTIDVAVKSYSVQSTVNSSANFDWEAENQKIQQPSCDQE